jgi:hypothetical protein
LPCSPVPTTMPSAWRLGARPCTCASISAWRNAKASLPASKAARLGSRSLQMRGGLLAKSRPRIPYQLRLPEKSCRRDSKGIKAQITGDALDGLSAMLQLSNGLPDGPRASSILSCNRVQHGFISLMQLAKQTRQYGSLLAAGCRFPLSCTRSTKMVRCGSLAARMIRHSSWACLDREEVRRVHSGSASRTRPRPWATSKVSALVSAP